jgi:hypothetical protein
MVNRRDLLVHGHRLKRLQELKKSTPDLIELEPLNLRARLRLEAWRSRDDPEPINDALIGSALRIKERREDIGDTRREEAQARAPDLISLLCP